MLPQSTLAFMLIWGARGTQVIMLSMEHAAAGTNLQCANHVVLLEPPGINPAHGVTQVAV